MNKKDKLLEQFYTHIEEVKVNHNSQFGFINKTISRYETKFFDALQEIEKDRNKVFAFKNNYNYCYGYAPKRSNGESMNLLAYTLDDDGVTFSSNEVRPLDCADMYHYVAVFVIKNKK